MLLISLAQAQDAHERKHGSDMKPEWLVRLAASAHSQRSSALPELSAIFSRGCIGDAYYHPVHLGAENVLPVCR